MSEEIISFDEYGLALNTFWGGKEKGKCVQFTTDEKCYTQMTYEKAIEFLQEALVKLIRHKEKK